MRKIGLIILIPWLLLQSAFSQFNCEIITNGQKKSGGQIQDYLNYIPSSSTPMKYIRLNFHFMLLEDPQSPGNFTEFDDGRGNTNFTGYDFIKDLLYWTNFRLDRNCQMTYPLDNSTSVISRKYQFVLNGVFFHRDSTKYWLYSSPENTYSENIGEAINIFLQSNGTIVGGGYANMSGNRFVDYVGMWDCYDYYVDGGQWGNWANAAGVMHETGHNLSLLHTILTSGGDCCDYCDDYCTDTPTRNYVIQNDGIDPCELPAWNNSQHSNNIMEYAGFDAITPEQLGRVHWTIQNEIQDYQPCMYNTSSLNITNFQDNKAYIAEIVTITPSSSLIVDDNKAMYINTSEVTINGPFEIEIGSQLNINIVPSCN